MFNPFGNRRRLTGGRAFRRSLVRRRHSGRAAAGMHIEPLEGRRLLAADATDPFVLAAAPQHGVVVIDSSLVASMPQEELAGSLVIGIDDSRDAIDQITTGLAGLSNVDVVRVISHGSDGSLWFGGQRIDAATLAARAGEVAGWRRSLAADGDILLYGCSVASTDFGRDFVRELAGLTEADVAASTNLTGAGGDETLEFQVGDVTHSLLAPATAYDRAGISLIVEVRNSSISSFTNNGDGTGTITMSFELSGQFYYAGGYYSNNGYMYMYLDGDKVATQPITVGSTTSMTARFPLHLGDNEISVNTRDGFPTSWSDPDPKILTIEAPYYLGMPSTLTVPVGQWQNQMYVVSNAFGTPTIRYSATNLPRGVTIDSRGVILGIPETGTAGVYNVVLQATNGFATATHNMTVTVTNQAPSFTSTTPAVLSGAAEDTDFTITHAALAAALDESDPNNDPLSFRIESLLGGTLTKNGSPVAAGSTLLGPGESLVWTPPPTVNGTLDAFTVKVSDGALFSATAKTVRVSIGAVNDRPTFSQFSGPVASGNEDTVIPISLAALLGSGDEADIDGSVTAFVVKSVTTGTLRIGSSSATATAWNATTNAAITSSLSAYWTPDANANGAQSAFTAVARDDGGLESLTPVQAVVSVTAVNDSPTLTSMAIISGATASDPFEITYATLANAANAADVDADAIAFRIEAISTGSLDTWSGSAWTAVTAGTTLIAAGEKLRWTPAAGTSGLRNAFTVRAWDGQAASATAIQVRVDGDVWRVRPWTDAASSGISTLSNYTHAYSFGAAGSFDVNGLTFTGLAGANPAVTDRLSTTGFGGLVTNDANSLADASRSLANDAVSTSASSASVTLRGLAPGGRYVLSLYTVGRDTTARLATLSSAMGQLTVDQNTLGTDNGVRIDYQYLADASGSVTISLAVPSAAFSLYGLANREVAPAIGLYAPSALTYDAAPKPFQAYASAANPLPFISAGTLHSVVLRSDGTVSAFGTNQDGQTNVPAGLANVVAVSAGGYHTMALTSAGTVVAWGNNYASQSTVPAGLSNVVAIAAGGSHSLALRNDGTVVAWGSNSGGQTNVPAGLTGVVAIAAGSTHSLALKGDGTVVAWGYGFYNYATPPAGLTDVVAISAGEWHSLALKSDGTVVAWGNNGSFQCNVPAGLKGVVAVSAGTGHSIALKADGTVVAWGDRDNYGSTVIPAGLSGVVAIDAGGEHSIALKSDGTVVTFGWTRFGQQYIPNSTGTLVQVSAGVNHTLALRIDGSVVAWGANYQGQLNVPAGLTGVAAVQAGNNFSVALKGDGTVVAWGYNQSGQRNVPAGLADVVKISATGDHVLALKRDGTVVAWGSNQYGQTDVPSGLTDVVDIAAGGDRSLALKRDGTVVGWGNYGNQWLPAGLTGIKAISCGGLFALLLKTDGTVLAYGYNNHGESNVPAGLIGVVAIDAGYQHALALKADGTVVGWGNAAWGVTTPPDSTRGVGVVAVVAGSSTSYALKSDGTVIGWGLDAGDNQPPRVGLAGRMTPILNSYTYSYQGRGSTAYAASSTAPTNAGDYTVTATATATGNTVSVNRDFTIAKVTPAPFYYTRTNTITYGAALTSQQVDTLPAWWWNQGTFTQIPGTTTFFPTIGTVLPAGTHTLQLTFVPTDSINFNPAVATSTITVQKATVAAGSIALTPPATLTYTGEAKAYTASATDVAGFTYSYSGRAGTVYGPSSVAPTYAGDYTVTATVADPNSQGSKSLDFTVAKVVPVITAVPTATALTFGQTLASSTLSGGTASVPGSFAFRDSTLQVNAAGSIPQDLVFTPTDTVNYATVAGTVFVNVSALAIAAGAFTFSAPGSLVYNGAPKTHSATAAGPSGTLYGMSYSYAGIGGTTYGPSTTAPTNAGSYAVTATLTGSNFTGNATRTFTITQAVPTVTWATPANIAYGTALSATQLSATASVAGSFTYTPAVGTVLAAGARTLEAVFTPTDTVNYASVTTTRPLQVTTSSLPISLVPPPLVYDGTAKGYVVSQMAYLSSGWDHSVALNTNGTVTAFGSNSEGQTSVPAGLSGVVQVSAGAYHSVAVKSNGTLVTWGSNSWSQGSGAVLNLPYTGPGWTAITQRDVITNATAAAAGGVLTVVLRTDGTVTVLGDSYETSAVNVPAGLSGVTAVAAGWEHAVALKADGTVVAWGENVHGQTNVPAGLSGVVAIAAWGNHTLALKSDGTVVAWGNNSARQTTVPAGLSGIVAITAAFSSSFALKADGSVIGWGSMSPVSAFRQVAAPGSGVVAFSSDANGNLRLLKSDGTVTTVDGTSLATGIGFPAYSVSYTGRAGTTYAASSTPPTNAGSYAVTVTSTDLNYSASRTVDFTIAKATPTITTLPQAAIITEGQDLSAAILDGGVGSVPGTFAFTSPGFVPSAGSTTQEITFTPTDSVNYASVTATVTVRSQGASAAVPTILTPPTAAAITFGQRLQVSTLSGGVASVPGTFVYSSRLTVPNPGTARQSVTFVPDDIASYAAVTILVPLTVYDGVASPLNVSLVPPASLTYDGSPKAFRVARGSLVSSGNYGHFLVVKSDATVGAFGDNSAGQLNVPAGLTGVVAVAAGEGSAMALKADGTVVEWGSLWMGTAPAGLSGVVAIARGTSHALALKADGTVVAWGYNGSGQCNVPAGLTGVVAIAGSVSSSFALKSDGTIVAWGANAYGQLDIPAGLSGVVALSTSSYGPIAALKSDGTVVCWGKNDKGQATVPAGLSGVVAVAAGENHTVALKSDGTVVAWGDGTSFTPTGWNGNLVPWNLANVVAIDASSDATYAIRADGSVVWWGQRSSYGAARVNGEIYRTPSGAGVSVPEITPLLAADSAGFAFSTTYAGRESTTYSATATPPTEPGDYSVTVTGTDPDFAATKTLAFTIARATPTITAAPTAAGITFGESLASAALSGGGASVAGSFAFAAPGTIPNAGTASQTVVFTPADAVRYLPVALNVSVAVAQATPTLVTLPTAATIAYGQTLASAVLGSGLASVPGVFAFTAPGTAPTAGSAARSVTFTPTDTVNYAPITASVDVLVIRATPSVSVSPTSTSIRAGQSLANAILSGGTASVPGTFAFADTSLAPSSGTASQDVVFTPTDAANYAPVTLGVAVRVRSFDPGDVADIAGEAGGVANAAAGFDAVGNVLDGQSNYDGTAIAVTAVTGPGGAGTVGSALAGTYGSLTLRSDGSYVYVVNDTNPTVQALPLGATLQDDFSYTVASATDSATAALRVTVYGGNDAPTFSAVGGSPLKATNEDTEVSITLAELLAAGNETDLDGTVVAFVVTSLAGGTLRIGADAASALPWDADSNSLIDATQNAYWTPAADLSGTLPAFAIVARDDGGSDSPTPVTVQIAVTPVNDAPALTPVEITFIDTIAADSFAPVSGTFAASDVDVDSLTFGVTGATPAGDVVTQAGSYGTLVVNRLTGAYAFTPNATVINAATTAVSETFPIVVSDGAATTAALLTISIAATDDRPTLSALESHATPGTEDTATEVSFADLLSAGNEADVDGTVTAFVVTEVKSGRLVIGSSAATATEWNPTTNHLITSTLKAFWTPDTNAFGLLDAFSVVARDDGGNESTTPVVYRVSVASANDAPSLTSFPLVVGTTAEDTQAELTFAALAAVGDEADIDGTVTAFVVTAVASGTLRIGATAATASPWDSATNAVVATGLQAYWTPAANASGTLTAFSVVARDDGGLDSPIAVPVSVLVSAVNDPPVNTVPAAQAVNEDTDLVFSAANGNAISVADLDLGSLPAEVTLTATNGVLTLGSTTGLTFTTGDGTADATLVFTGARADVSAALAGLTFRPTANFYGAALLTVTTSDQGGSGSGGPLADTDTVAITVLSVNDTPTDITLTGSTVAENAASGTTVGTLATTDVDTGDTFTYTLVAGTGDTDNAAFAVDGSTLKTAASFDFEARSSYTVRVRSTDANGLTAEKPFTISVTNVNEVPTDITLSGNTVAENASSGTTIGTLSTTDFDAGDTFTYSLVSGTGDADNGSFSIDGGTLKTAASFDFETKSSYTVRVRSTDVGGLFTEKAFTILVTDVNETPSNIDLTANTVAENAPSGTAIGTLSTTDIDAGDSFTYSLVSGTGDTDNASFSIDGGTLKTTTSFNFETKSGYTVRVRSTDASGLFTEKAFTILVTNVNETPTDIGLSANAVAENASSGTSIGTLATTDVDVGDTFTYTLVSGADDTDNTAFTIDGSTLKTIATFDFETKSSHTVRVRSTDVNGLFTEKAFTILVTDVNETPSDIGLSANTVAEDAPSGTAIGILSSADVDASDTFTYSLVSGIGDADNTSFAIDGRVLRTAASLNFETKSSHTVRVRSTDVNGLFTEKAFTILVTDVNEAPSDIGLSANTVAEDAPSGTAIGIFSFTDVDAGDSFTYSLVSGTGDTDNAAFSIDGGTLKAAASFNFEVKNSYTVRVRSTDDGGLFTEKAFTILVTDVNETPSDIGLSANTVAEDAPSGTAIGIFSFTDVDAGDTFTYSLVSGIGDADNGSFSIDGNTLKTAASFTFEAKSSYTVRVRSTDAGGLFTEKAFTILVTNVNEVPTDIGLTANTVAENAPSVTTIGNLSTTDVDTGDTFTYSLVSGTGDTDNAAFAIDGGTLKTAASFNFEAKSSYTVRVRTTDVGGLFTEKAFTILVTDVNETPSDIGLSAHTVAENAPSGTAIGTLSTTDIDAGDSFTYSLVSGTGDTDNAAFSIDGGTLKTAASFNFEVKNSYTVRVRSTDDGGLFTEKAFTILVTDVNETPSDIGLSANTVAENAPSGTSIGTLSTTDVDAGDTFTYTLVPGTGSADNASFTIAGNVLKAAATFNFEAKSSYTLRIRATDAGGLFTEKSFTVTVTNVNEAPSDIVLSANTVPENSPAGTAVGMLSTTDVDAADIFTYTLVSGVGGTDNAAFTIDGSTLKTAASFNFEARNSYSIRVRTTDANGLFAEKVFTITVTNVNEAPTDITLSASSIVENAAVGSIVGTLSSTDPDAGDTFTYSLVAGGGSTDNASFTIVGNTLRTATAFDFEARSSYSVRVRTTDARGRFVGKAFTIRITNVNEAPTVTSVGTASVAENQTAVQTVTGLDPDAGTTLNYGIVGGADAAKFTINSSTGVLAFITAPNFENPTDVGVNNVYDVTVQVSDGTLMATKAVAVTVTNVNEVPTDITLTPASIAENSAVGAVVGAFATADVDANDAFTYALVGGQGDADNASFQVVGNQLKANASFNFESRTSYSVRVRATDQGGLATEKAFTIAVTDLVEPATAPTATVPAGFTVLEDTPTGLVFTGTPFADADSPAAKVMTVRLSVADGVIAATTGDGVTVAGTAVARTFSGTLAALNAFFTSTPARITYTPKLHSTAARTLTMRISESNGTGTLSSSATSPITITPVNDAPVVSVPASFTVTEDVKGNLVWPAALTPFVDVDSTSLTVTLAVADGTITAASTAAVTVGGTDTTRTFTGTPAGLNAFFKTLGAIGYTTARDNTIARTLTTTVSDGSLSAFASTQISITPVNDAPTVNAAARLVGGRVGTPYEITYDTLRAALAVADVDSPSPSILITAVDAGTVQKWNGTSWVTVSTAATSPLAQRLLSVGQKIRWLPPASASGDRAAFKVKARDGALNSAVTAQVTVNLAPA